VNFTSVSTSLAAIACSTLSSYVIREHSPFGHRQCLPGHSIQHIFKSPEQNYTTAKDRSAINFWITSLLPLRSFQRTFNTGIALSTEISTLTVGLIAGKR